MNDTQTIVSFIGAFGGAFAAFVLLKVEVAIATQKAASAKDSADKAHERLDTHVSDFHSK